MNIFLISVNLSLIMEAKGDGDCAIHALHAAHCIAPHLVAEMRNTLADVVVGALLHTNVYTASDNYLDEAEPTGAWLTAVGIQAYAAAYRIPVIVFNERTRTEIDHAARHRRLSGTYRIGMLRPAIM